MGAGAVGKERSLQVQKLRSKMQRWLLVLVQNSDKMVTEKERFLCRDPVKTGEGPRTTWPELCYPKLKFKTLRNLKLPGH